MEFRAGCHRLLILPCSCLMENAMTAAMVVRTLMVKLESGHYIQFILPGIQEIKKEMQTAMEK
eukprot:9008219-Ditylum_brightwellii.AAC.1